jgi:hypothetical protein
MTSEKRDGKRLFCRVVIKTSTTANKPNIASV